MKAHRRRLIHRRRRRLVQFVSSPHPLSPISLPSPHLRRFCSDLSVDLVNEFTVGGGRGGEDRVGYGLTVAVVHVESESRKRGNRSVGMAVKTYPSRSSDGKNSGEEGDG